MGSWGRKWNVGSQMLVTYGLEEGGILNEETKIA